MITVTAAAARLGLSGARVRVLIAPGRIKAVKVSPRLWLVSEPVRVLPATSPRSPA
jgi:excisionase family DNA binding protein